MDVSYRWLRDVAPTVDGSPDEVARRLAARGAPVEGSTPLGSDLAGLRVARVRRVRDHPNADRLVLCDVDTGEDEVQVVCGAPNVEEGALYPFAPVGSALPGGMEIGAVEIRGEASRGMLCSEKELGLGPDHEGILKLPADLELGTPLAEALGLDDVRLDVEVTPNRGDLLSHLGVARELAPGGDTDLRPTPLPEGAGATSAAGSLELETSADVVEASGVRVRIDDPDGCHRYLAAVVRGVEVKPSPPWLARRLRAAGVRPVNNVVDVTNFVLLERGQPLHAFDLDRLEEETVVVRGARAGEAIRTLDGVDRSLDEGTLCICDARRPVAVAGVMGGEDSEVEAGTTRILLECALFEPTRVRAAREALELSTESSYRFERGVDPEGLVPALRRALELILATAGGEAEPVVPDVNARPWERPTVPLRPERVRRVLGVAFEASELRELLEPLGFDVEESGDAAALTVSVPGWRSWDVTREVDLVEEVARAHGYDAFPVEAGPFRPGTVPDHPLFGLEDRIRDLLVGRGFLEAQVPAFARAEEGEVALRNPISAEETHLRTSLVPGLLRRVEHNFARGIRDVRLFELGTCFFESPHGARPREEFRVALVATGRRRPPHWTGPDEPVDFWDVKGWLEELAGAGCAAEATVAPVDVDGFVPGRSLLLRSADGGGAGRGAGADGGLSRGGGGAVGRAGRIPDDALDAPPWADAVWALEIVLPDRPEPPAPPTFRPLPAFPGVARDLALIVPDDLPAERVARTIEGTGGPLLDRVSVFDLYRGEGVPDGSRSIAFRLHFSSPERTLTDEDVDEATDRVVHELEEELGVEPRG